MSGGRLKVLRKLQILADKEMMRMPVQVELPRPLLWVEALAVTEWHLEISKVISCVYIRNKIVPIIKMQKKKKKT